MRGVPFLPPPGSCVRNTDFYPRNEYASSIKPGYPPVTDAGDIVSRFLGLIDGVRLPRGAWPIHRGSRCRTRRVRVTRRAKTSVAEYRTNRVRRCSAIELRKSKTPVRIRTENHPLKRRSSPILRFGNTDYSILKESDGNHPNRSIHVSLG